MEDTQVGPNIGFNSFVTLKRILEGIWNPLVFDAFSNDVSPVFYALKVNMNHVYLVSNTPDLQAYSGPAYFYMLPLSRRDPLREFSQAKATMKISYDFISVGYLSAHLAVVR